MENKSPSAAYCSKDNIVLQEDTTLTILPGVKTQAITDHTAKMALRAADMSTYAALSYMGNVTGSPKRGK